MGRPLTPEKAAEFEDLLRFLEHFDQVGWVPPRNPPPETRAEVARIEAQFGKSKALSRNDLLTHAGMGAAFRR
jgi:hypothetical protein